MNTISGYEFTEELYNGPNSLVYRGYRVADKQPIILKILNQAYPSPEKIASFKREYEITRSLNLSTQLGPVVEGVVQAYELIHDQNRWVMVLEDFGGEALARLIQRSQFTLADSLTLIIRLVDILDQVHQRHIIHKDINPSNLVLNPETGQLKLIDFGIATTLTRENPTLHNPNVLEGTLTHISPEQTGRMNRAIDYRADFYSLGATFYELLTGQLPFSSPDAMGLVHCHIAKQPVSPSEIKPDIPLLLSDITMKLLAKNAEDRYQSARGLKADLEVCLHQWQTRGQVDSFLLGQNDASSHFQIPQKLYGREQEIDLLLTAFERVSQGASEVMMISGYTGIGKTSLVQEVYKPITRQRGYFIAGKFDQLRRDIPYASLIQAFRLLVRQLLPETEVEITAWREKLLAALSPNGQVIIEVIPEVELIIGPQPDVPNLSPVEAQNRFNLVFQNFIKVFTQSEHPLVVFLDDLQWADGASLKLLEVLMTARDSAYLFLIGAYRNNEVGEAHPLLLALAEIQKGGARVNQVSLSPLILAHLVQLIADTLHCTSAQARPLAELILAKTGGNPFFINEFLKSLHTEELLLFDFQQGHWQWDLEKIQARDITDNVAELMSHKVQRLDERTQRVLKLAACIGNRFDLQTLAVAYEKSPRETAAHLWEAIAEGMVLPLDDAYKLIELDVEGLAEAVTVEYKFAHDQIQQAVYSLIPEADKQAMHQRLGQLLLEHEPPTEQDRKIFDIVNHLNLARQLASQPSKQDELAQLNLLAGKKAKGSAAYQPALTYLQTGLELLTSSTNGKSEQENSWTRQYDLTLDLYIEAAEAAYLNGAYEQMEQWAEVVLQQATTLLAQVRVYEIKIQAYIAQNKWPEAMQTGLFVLNLLGIRFPKKPKLWHILRGLVGTKSTLAGKRIEDLKDLPEMRDPVKLAAMRIFKVISGVVFISTPQLFPLIVFKQINLSVKYGNTAQSGLAYAAYGIILCGVMVDIEAGYRFGQLALDVLKRFNARALEAQILFVEHFFIRPWKEHLRETLKPLLEAYQRGLETGDLEFAANPISVYILGLFFVGKELGALEQEIALYTEILTELKQERTLYQHALYQQTVWNLLRPSEHPYRLVGEKYNEEEILALHLEANDLNAICHLNLIKLILHYLFQKYPQAIENVAKIEANLGAFTGMYTTAVAHFYNSLARLAIFPEASQSDQRVILKKVAASQKKMKKWAKHAPMNYSHKFYLVEAELASVLGKDNEARTYYDKAIDLAHQNEYLNEEALAYELAAKFYLAKGQTRLAHHYLHIAHYTYRRWGAMAKVKDLETCYPQFLAPTRSSGELSTLTTPTTASAETASSVFDLNSVLKASQVISGEIVLDQLLEKLMKIVIENAGAQRGCLILEQEGRWVIEAEGKIDQGEAKAETAEPEVMALQSTPVEASEKLPIAVINYVTRSKEHLVLDDASREGIFNNDPYIIQNQPKSLLCMPLINQGKLIGLLYLENNLTIGAFSSDRLELLNILSAQAAISIENARLYAHQVELTQSASRFVPQEFLQFLRKDSIAKVNLGDQVQQTMTILVSDIRSFTTLSETMTPQENFDFVNAYLGRVSPIIRQHHGLIAKYMGDGMMAVFPRRVEDAINAAIETLRQVARYNVERRQQGQAPIQIGAGIHTGTVMLGTVGEAQRMQLDLFSDAVNVAARLEGLSKLYGVPLILSTEALQQAVEPGHYQIRFLGKTAVKGRQEMLSVFEVFDGDPAEVITLKLETKTDFEKGLSFYHTWQFVEAKVHFEQVLQYFPEDKASQFYLKRMADFTEYKLPVEEASRAALTQ